MIDSTSGPHRPLSAVAGRRSLRTPAQRVRLIFAVIAVATVLAQVMAVFAMDSRRVPVPLTVAAGAALLTLWWYALDRDDFGPWASSAELGCLLVLGLNVAYPVALLGPLAAALCLGCLFQSHLAAAARTAGCLVVLGIVTAVVDPSVSQAGLVFLGALPALAATATAARALAVHLDRLAVGRDLATRLADTGLDLLAAEDLAAVRSVVEACVHALVPDALLVRLVMGVDESLRAGPHVAVLDLAKGGRRHGRLIVVPGKRLRGEQQQALQMIAAQATAVVEAMTLRAMLSHHDSHDALTSLPNRTLFAEALSGALRRRDHTVATLIVDLDDFKSVNDSLGHAAGDRLLIEVADRLRRGVRPADLVARMGGDEFAVLLDGVATGDEAIVVSRRIVADLEEPFDIEGSQFILHCSIGVALGRSAPHEAAEAAAELLRNADMAMHVAKARGKNRYELYTDSMADAAIRDQVAREQLSGALANGELELFFQPIVSITTGRVEMVESLVRWRHPERGLLLPDDFLPQAVQVGLMPQLERWVIGAACEEAAAWPGDDPPAVAVNISPRHLSRPWLVPTVEQALQKSGLPGRRLVIEITEESVVREPVAAEANLRECMALGVRVAMDDFGSGYASLSHISALPISTLKIDRSLITQAAGPLLVRAVVELAHSLGLHVVAEGVEEPSQLEWLRASSCDAVQGYLLARPAPASALSLAPRRTRPEELLVASANAA